MCKSIVIVCSLCLAWGHAPAHAAESTRDRALVKDEAKMELERSTEANMAAQFKVRAAAIDLKPEQRYDILKHLPGGRPKSVPKVIAGPRGTPVQGGADHVKTFDAIPEIAKQLEVWVGPNNLLPVAFLEGGAQRQRAVGRVIFKATHQTPDGTFFEGDAWGTGFLVSSSLLMTNNHVVGSAAFAKEKVRIQFNFQRDLQGNSLPTEEYDLDPDSFFVTSPSNELDYTIVRVKPRREPTPSPAVPPATIATSPGQHWGNIRIEKDPLVFLPTNPNQPKQQLNIIEHPAGRFKEIAIHDNFIDELTTDVVRYTSDTEPGSSGSPVFNNFWQLVALHHAGGERVNRVWKNNEGILMSRIIQDLRKRLQQDPDRILGEMGL